MPKEVSGKSPAAGKSTPAPLDGEALERAQRARLVRKTRTDLGLSPSEFAAKFQVPVAVLQGWEQGEEPVPDFALAYIRVIAAYPELVGRTLSGGS